MTRKMSRREFIKAAGVGVTATAVLTGCGPTTRYVVREPYTRMPEYTYNGQSTYYATTCRECPAGCGIVVRTEQGRALKVEGNPIHPINFGKTCARGQVALQGLYNPDRIQFPQQQAGRGSQNYSKISWDEAVATVQNALQTNQPSEIGFLLGMSSDHLFDLVSDLCTALGAPAPIRYGAHELFDARLTLLKATQQLFASTTLPYFDLASADVTFSFGANFLETYLSPMAFSRGFAQMRRGKTGQRGYLVQFEPRLSLTAASADEWVPVVPGTEGIVAQAIGQLISENHGGVIPNAFQGVDIKGAAASSGVAPSDLQRWADMFSSAAHPLAIPGGGALGSSNGLETAQAVLALNALSNNMGKEGGIFGCPPPVVNPAISMYPGSLADMHDLVGRMQRGELKTLFIHGFNPLFELPGNLGFKDALANVPQVISFASFPDETSLQADFIFPDHTGLESWGYQKPYAGVDRAVVSGFQPVVVPFYSTKATADVLLAAVQGMGGSIAAALPYKDVVEYMENSLVGLVTQAGYFNAPEIKTFRTLFQQYGGWWSAVPGLIALNGSSALSLPIPSQTAQFAGPDDLYLHPFISPILGDGSGANKPWLQEIPDPTTTVMWNSWVEINPVTADTFGLENDDVVRIISPVGTVEAPVYRYPAIRPDTIAIPFGQGHSVFGRYAQGRGINPGDLVSLTLNGADDLAYTATKVRIEKTGRKKLLSRLESKMGVYGELVK